MLRTGGRGRWMSALSPTAGLPASSFVSSLLEVLGPDGPVHESVGSEARGEAGEKDPTQFNSSTGFY